MLESYPVDYGILAPRNAEDTKPATLGALADLRCSQLGESEVGVLEGSKLLEELLDGFLGKLVALGQRLPELLKAGALRPRQLRPNGKKARLGAEGLLHAAESLLLFAETALGKLGS